MKKKAQQEINGTFKVNLDVVKSYDNSMPYLRLVRQEIKNGNGYVQVKSMTGDKAEIYGAGTNSWILGGVFVPFEALVKTTDDRIAEVTMTKEKKEEKPQCKVIEDAAKYANEPNATPLIERIPRTVRRIESSDQLINDVPNVPDVQGPVEESDAKPIKPREEQMTEQKEKELEVNEGLVSPEIVVEWAMRDAQSNQSTVLEEIERLGKDYGLTDKQKEDAMEYYEKIRSRNQRDASFLYKIVDEVGNGFNTFPEAFSYMTMDVSKEEKYRLKRIAKKAGLMSE